MSSIPDRPEPLHHQMTKVGEPSVEWGAVYEYRGALLSSNVKGTAWEMRMGGHPFGDDGRYGGWGGKATARLLVDRLVDERETLAGGMIPGLPNPV